MIRRIGIALCFVVPTVSSAGEPSMPEKDDSSQSFVTSRLVRVGVDLRLGGAVTYVSKPGGPNLINSFDLGRQIQQSYYSGPGNYQKEGKQKSPNWSSFPWNPIQTGDAYANGSKVLAHHVRDGELYIKTAPKPCAWRRRCRQRGTSITRDTAGTTRTVVMPAGR